MHRIAEFLLDDAEFKRALAMACPTGKVRAATEADLEQQEKKLAREDSKLRARLDRLVKAIADGVIDGADAKTERERIQAEQDRLSKRQAELAQQRTCLSHKVKRVKLIEETRTYFARMVKRAKDLLALPMEQKRDLLRALLPSGSESCIKVVSWEAPEYPEAFPKWRIEIVGLLPIEQAELKKAVLGGALAVP
jgi:hypothetical protein